MSPPRVPPAVARAVLDRANERCECCGRPTPEDQLALHHRLLRSAGGKHTVANLLAVRGACHDRIHANRGGQSYDLGHLIRRGADPEHTPVQLRPRPCTRAGVSPSRLHQRE